MADAVVDVGFAVAAATRRPIARANLWVFG